MADFTQEQFDAAIKKALEENNATRDEAEKGLKSKMEELLGEKKTAKADADAAIAEAVKAAEAKARKDGDFEAMDKSWGEKYAKLEADNKTTNDTNAAAINKLTAGATVKDISAAMALKGSEGIFEQIISNRVGVEMRDGNAIVQILDKSGKPSAATIDDFKKELLADAALKPLLAGSQGSGGGAANQNGGAGSSKTVNLSGWNDMSTAERGEFSNNGGQVVDD